MNPNTALTVNALRLRVLFTLQSGLTRGGHRVLLHRGSFLVKILLRNLRALFLLWNFLSGEVHLHAPQVAQLGVQTGTIHPCILVPIVPKRDVVQCLPEHRAETSIVHQSTLEPVRLR
jgi:hypothetical protein